ncbi:MAG: hypothetical protein QXR38_03275 [Nitrososphaerales archaeon]
MGESRLSRRTIKLLNSYLTLGLFVATIHAILLYCYAQIGLTDYASRGDGQEYMYAAEALSQGKLIGAHLPLYPALIAITSFITPKEVAALSIPAILHTLFTLVAYKALMDTGLGNPWLYALMIAFVPPSVLIYSSSALSDGVALFFIALSFYYGLRKKEGAMLLSSFLAASTHYMGSFLVIPLAWKYWKADKRRLPLALVPLLPLVILSLIQYATTGNLFHYVSVHFAYSLRVWGTQLFLYPFASLLYTATALKGIQRAFWLTYLTLVYVSYGVGLFHSAKKRRSWSTVFSIPFYAFTVVYTGYYFIPRFLAYSFPSLMEYAEIERKFKPVRWLITVATLISLAYALWFLLIRVPSTGFTR